jgi:hypothetical protein
MANKAEGDAFLKEKQQAGVTTLPSDYGTGS